MGFISVRSSRFAKPDKRLMGTACSWAACENDGCQCKAMVKEPNPPVVKAVKDFLLPQIERYSKPSAVPTPEAVPLAGAYVYPDGKEEPTRIGQCWTVGKGRMFCFAPGHETDRDFCLEPVQRIYANAVERSAKRSWPHLVARLRLMRARRAWKIAALSWTSCPAVRPFLQPAWRA